MKLGCLKSGYSWSKRRSRAEGIKFKSKLVRVTSVDISTDTPSAALPLIHPSPIKPQTVIFTCKDHVNMGSLAVTVFSLTHRCA